MVAGPGGSAPPPDPAHLSTDPYTLPEGLPIPEDDGAADGLPGTAIPSLVLESSAGPVDLAALCAGRGVVYVYPRTGRPGVPMLPGWDEIPGARGCTPQSCAFRDHAAELGELGAAVAGVAGRYGRPVDDPVPGPALGRRQVQYILL